MYLRSYLVVLGLVLATFSSPVKYDALTFIGNFKDLEPQIKSLGSSIAAFPDGGATIAQVMAIAQSASTLNNAIQIATSGASSITSFTEADGSTILNRLKEIASSAQKALTDLVNKHAAVEGFTRSGFTDSVKQELEKLESNSDLLLSAILGKLPVNSVGEAGEQKTLIDSAFNSAISAYSS